MQRVALITGCSSGIGRATALAFLEEEWDVVATSRDQSDLAALREAGCLTASLDVTDDAQVEAVVADTLDRFGRIDCVVNNAGFSMVGPAEDVSVEDLHRQFDVNVYGPHRLARAVLPHMREREDGTIINISSGVGRVALPGSGAYSASKFALEAFSDAMRAEVSPFGIDVVLIEPGNVNTAFADRASRELTRIDRTAAYDPLYKLLEDWATIGGFGPAELEPRDVADTIVNAASATDPDPRYVLGITGWGASIAGYVPGRIRDALYRLAIRVTSIRSET